MKRLEDFVPDPADALTAEIRTNQDLHEALLMTIGCLYALLSKDGEDEWADMMRADLEENRDDVRAACRKWEFYRNSHAGFPLSVLSAVDPHAITYLRARGLALAAEASGNPMESATDAVVELISTLSIELYGDRKGALVETWGEEAAQAALRSVFGGLAPTIKPHNIMDKVHTENWLTLLAERGDVRGALPGWQVDEDDQGYTFGMDAEEMGGPRADCYRNRSSFALWDWRAQRDGHHFEGTAKTARNAMKQATAKMDTAP